MSVDSTVGVQEDQPSQDEYRQIEREIDTWKLPQKSHRSSLHIHEDCPRLSARTSEIVEKEPAVYPYGYNDVCQHCLWEYRKEQ